jgi:hypothetical protein
MLTAAVPLALGLVAVASVPVLIHLLTRQRVRTRHFPALAFLARADHGRARRSRMTERLILGARTLALAAAALAAAGLMWRGELAMSERPAVIILDGSASMRQIVDGTTAFDRARALAGRMLDRWSSRPVALVVADGRIATVELPQRQHGSVRARLAEAVPGWGDGDPAGAVNAAVTALGASGGDCVLITDLARGCLSGCDPHALPTQVALRLVDVGGGGDNCAVTALTTEPAVTVAGRPCTVTARITNAGRQAVTVRAALRVGREQRLETTTIAAGSSAEVSVRFQSDTVGMVRVEASITDVPESDALVDDNRRCGVLTVVPALTSVLVSDADRNDPAGPVRPLAAALAAAGLEPHVTDSAGLAAECQAQHPALVATVAVQGGGALPALSAYLASGGSWLQCVANDADAALVVPGTPPPVALGGRMDVSDQERGQMAVAQANLDHPLGKPFVGREALLTGIAAYRYRLTPARPAADAVVLLAYGDGTIALAERPVGTGHWLLCNASPARADSNLAQGEALPLLCAQLPTVLLPGRSVPLALDAMARWSSAVPVSDEHGRELPVQAGQVLLDAPGWYRAVGGRQVAVGIPALESDLRRLDPTVLGLASAERGEAALDLVTTTPLWPWLLGLALLCLALESVWAGGVPLRREQS